MNDYGAIELKTEKEYWPDILTPFLLNKTFIKIHNGLVFTTTSYKTSDPAQWANTEKEYSAHMVH